MPKKSTKLPKNASFGKEETIKPTTIDQVLGDRGEGKYRYLRDPFNEDCYKDYLNSMLPSDLYSHAQEFGFSFVDNKNLLIGKLMDTFRKDRAQYKMPDQPKSSGLTEKDLSPEMQKFLAGAR